MVDEGFCVRCRKKVEMQNVREVQYRNKRWAKKGTCPECGGTVAKTIPNKKSLLERIFGSMPKPKKEDEKEKETQGVPAPE